MYHYLAWQLNHSRSETVAESNELGLDNHKGQPPIYRIHLPGPLSRKGCQHSHRSIPMLFYNLYHQGEGDFYCFPKIHKVNTPGRPIISGNGALCVILSGYVQGILKPILQGTPSFCCNTTNFLQKRSTHSLVEVGTFLVTMDISALYTSSSHDDGIAATASQKLWAMVSEKDKLKAAAKELSEAIHSNLIPPPDMCLKDDT
ncbi:uncharacterized protein LOC122553261 [Chiloscyllium plagiosum]|uniref:uncharacterized protein LOC122553261 n=1 Tax=Chiloscyllium plagiosum TaxID=36176 RepID=UPI001CB857BF|nr:uncharacterized protein LOC122553261 [Chiloscyllium plagiosum]